MSRTGQRRSGNRGATCLWLVLLGTVAMFAVEFWTATSTASFALVIGALRSGSDVVVLAYALSARLWLPAHARRTGLSVDAAKVEALVGFVGGLMLLMASVPVAYHAFARLLVPTDTDASTAMTVLGIGIGVNIASAFLILRYGLASAPTGHGRTTHAPIPDGPDLRRTGASSRLARFAVVGQLIDADVSVALLIGMAVADLCGWALFDALAGLAGAFLISISASKIVVREGAVLIDLTTHEG